MIIFLQCIIVTHGSLAFHVYKWYDNDTGGAGLHPYQWLICVGFGAGSLVVGFLLKFLPEEKCLEVFKHLNFFLISLFSNDFTFNLSLLLLKLALNSIVRTKEKRPHP